MKREDIAIGVLWVVGVAITVAAVINRNGWGQPNMTLRFTIYDENMRRPHSFSTI